ncbi:MAG TPA: aminopeptidase P family N-terminal domain-containing protein [Micropepsaceae bacterium]|nr:aminopeptidase P family N-terminal domain-containing protein [Micropepsaceae bacterium]
MRRGLMAWDADEIPIAALKGRVQRLQTGMAAAGYDALILYTNFVRSAAVSYLTAFSPYWADGVLLVPAHGEPLFATTLSKRVGNWIQTVKPVGDLVTSPTPGTVLAQRLAAGGDIRRVAILERDDFPAGLYSEIASALPGVEIVDGTDVFAAARAQCDAVEQRLLGAAARIAGEALGHLKFDVATDVGHAVGAVEQYARLQGAEETYVAIAPDLDSDRRFLRLSGNRPLGRRFAIRATVAYKGAWVRRVQTYSADPKDRSVIARADAWFNGVLARLDMRRPLGDQTASAIADLSGAQLTHWIAEGPVGTRPLSAIASSEGPAQTDVRAPMTVLTLGLTIDGMPWCGAGLAGVNR